MLYRIDIIKAELEEKQFKVKLTVIDTPGFGDYVNNRESWMPIIDFIVCFLTLLLLKKNVTQS